MYVHIYMCIYTCGSFSLVGFKANEKECNPWSHSTWAHSGGVTSFRSLLPQHVQSAVIDHTHSMFSPKKGGRHAKQKEPVVGWGSALVSKLRLAASNAIKTSSPSPNMIPLAKFAFKVLRAS